MVFGRRAGVAGQAGRSWRGHWRVGGRVLQPRARGGARGGRSPAGGLCSGAHCVHPGRQQRVQRGAGLHPRCRAACEQASRRPAACDDPDQACATAGEPAEQLRHAGYAIGFGRLRQFRDTVQPWSNSAPVRTLDEQGLAGCAAAYVLAGVLGCDSPVASLRRRGLECVAGCAGGTGPPGPADRAGCARAERPGRPGTRGSPQDAAPLRRARTKW